METLISFLPLMIMQAIYAVFAAQIAKRTNRSVPVFAILTLIPMFGAFFFLYVIWTTLLYILDSINELKVNVRAG